MEKDKNDSNVACFDCCYHPSAMDQIKVKKQFRESLILTAIEGVEEAYKRQSQEVSGVDSSDVVCAVCLSAVCSCTSYEVTSYQGDSCRCSEWSWSSYHAKLCSNVWCYPGAIGSGSRVTAIVSMWPTLQMADSYVIFRLFVLCISSQTPMDGMGWDGVGWDGMV
jgi:hypothetical protein